MENVNQAQLTNFIMRTSNQREKDLGTASGGVMHSTPQAGTRPGSIQVWKEQLRYPEGDAAPFWHLREGKWEQKETVLAQSIQHAQGSSRGQLGVINQGQN